MLTPLGLFFEKVRVISVEPALRLPFPEMYELILSGSPGREALEEFDKVIEFR